MSAPEKISNEKWTDKIRRISDSAGCRNFLLLVCSAISAAGFARLQNFSTTNVMTLLLAILMYPMFCAAFHTRKKNISIASLFCGAFFTFALLMYKYEWLTQQESHAVLYAFEFSVGFMLFFTALSGLLFEKLRDVRLNTAGEEPSKRSKLIVFFGSAAIMFFCWLPYFLMLYPGDVTSDSISELNQAVKDEPLSNHHPIVHTMMIRICYNLGFALFHDETKAVATYSVIQMLVLALGFAYLIVTMYKYRVKKLPILCVLGCYALLSYHGVYSVTMWKDIMFGFFVLTFTTTLWRALICDLKGQKKLPLFELVMLFFTGVGVCLFRSNGLYAYMLTVLFIVIFCIRSKKFVLMGVTCAALVAALIVKGPVYNSLNITPPDTIEGLAIPQQMIAAVVRNERELTPEQEELLSNVLPLQDIRERYTPNSADSIKFYMRDNGNQEYIAEHKGEFLKLWIDLGLKYPSDYTIAFVYSTLGYWYPDVQNWVYSGEFRWDNFETLHKEALVGEKTVEFLQKAREEYHVFYFLGLLWSIALEVWIAVFMMGTSFVKRKPQMLLLYLPVAGVWATLLLAAPVYAEFRYTYSIFCTVPLLCIIPFVSTEGLLAPRIAAAAKTKSEPAPKEAKTDDATAEASAETSDTPTEA